MSYTLDILPEEFLLTLDRDGDPEIFFRCPRCNLLNRFIYPNKEFNLDFFVELKCVNIECFDPSKGQSVGYSFEFTLCRGFECSRMLGLNDRPLNEVSK